MAFIQSAKMSIARNHGLEIDRDPAEIMRENNNALHEAASAVKKSKGMVRQSVPAPRTQSLAKPPVVSRKPVIQSKVTQQVIEQPQVPQVQTQVRTVRPNDADMRAQGYDKYMQNLMNAQQDDEEYEDDGVELSDIPFEEDVDETVEAEEELPPPPPPPQPKPKARPRAKKAQPQRVPVVETVAEQPAPAPVPKVTVVSEPRPVQARPVSDISNYSDVRGLPSGGLLYDMPIAGQALNLMDVMMMNYIDTSNATSTITTLFDRKFTGGWSDGFNAENILHCDESYLMHWLRASSITDVPLPYIPPTDTNQPFTCPHCHKSAVTADEYSRMPITFADLDFKIAGDLNAIVEKHRERGYYAFMLEDGRECDLYLRRRYHERMVNEYVEQYRAETGHEMDKAFEVVMRTAAVVEIEGADDILQKTEYLGRMGLSATRKFFDEVNSASLSTEITAKVHCPFCGEEVTIPYPFRLDYYISSL